MASETQKICKKVAVQMKDQAFNNKDCISVINVLTEFKRVCDSLRTHKGAPVWLFREFTNGPALAVIKVRLILCQMTLPDMRGPSQTVPK